MDIALPPTLRPSNIPRSLRLQVPRKTLRDRWNRLRFGDGAPLSDECIWVPTASLRLTYAPDGSPARPQFRRRHSGLILGGDWDLSVMPLGGEVKERSIRAHFLEGVPWEETELFAKLMRELDERGMVDGLRSRDELRARYRILDRIYDEARRTRRLRPQCELDDYFRREQGGIFVLIGRDGQLLRSSGGAHRLAIARILHLPRIPVQVGVVHRQAVERGHFAKLRRNGQP